MEIPIPCRILSDAIAAKLSDGIAVSKETYREMMSFSGMDRLDGLREILLDEASSEGASLLALVLFPDEGFQRAMEPILETYDFSRADEKMVCDRLISLHPETILHFPETGCISLSIPHEAMASLVTRLNITAKTDPGVLEALDQWVEDPLRMQCKIRLRNSRWMQNESHIQLLAGFIQKRRFAKDGFLESFTTILEFFTDPHPESDIREAILSEKERLIHLLDLADRQDHLLRTSPMEAILLQGVRMLTLDRTETIRRIRVLDQLGG